MDSPVEKFSKSNVVRELILGNCLERGHTCHRALVEIRGGDDLLHHVGPRD